MPSTFFPARGQPATVYVADDKRITHFAAEVMSLRFAPKLPARVIQDRAAAYLQRSTDSTPQEASANG